MQPLQAARRHPAAALSPLPRRSAPATRAARSAAAPDAPCAGACARGPLSPALRLRARPLPEGPRPLETG